MPISPRHEQDTLPPQQIPICNGHNATGKKPESQGTQCGHGHGLGLAGGYAPSTPSRCMLKSKKTPRGLFHFMTDTSVIKKGQFFMTALFAVNPTKLVYALPASISFLSFLIAEISLTRLKICHGITMNPSRMAKTSWKTRANKYADRPPKSIVFTMGILPIN